MAPRSKRLWALLSVLAAVILTAGLVYVHFSLQEHRKGIENFLIAIAEIKADQLAEYRGDLLATASGLEGRAGLMADLADLLRRPQEKDWVEGLARLEVLSRDVRVSGVFLVDAQGDEVLSLDKETSGDGLDRSLVAEALRLKRSVLSESLHQGSEFGLNLQTATPLFSQDGRALGAVVMVFQAESSLFPLLKNWPVPSASGELVLFQQDDDEVVFLSPLKKVRSAPFEARVPISLTDHVSVRGVLGESGLLEGKDYAGEQAVACVLPIPASPWFLVAKMDVTEAFFVWRLRSALLLGSVFGGLLMFGLLAWSMQQKDRLRRTEALLQAEQTARESQSRFDEVSEHSRTFAWEADLEGTFTYLSSAVALVLGYEPSELLGRKNFYDLHPEEGREACKVRNQEIFAQAGTYQNFENPAVAKNGEVIWLNTTALPIFDEQGRLTGYRGLDTDITEQKKHQADLALLGAAIEQAAEAVVITKADGTIEFVNKGFTKLTGYSPEEALGRNPRILKSGVQDRACYEEMWSTLTSGQTWEGQLVNRHKMGHLFTEMATITPVVNEHGRITNYVAVKRDISEYLRLSEQLGQAQKLESIGRLAGGVAHDFNNLITGIQGFAELGLDKLPPDHPARQDFVEILAGARQTAELTRQLLAFARQQPIAPRVLDLNATIENLLSMLRRLIGEDIALTWNPDPELWSVKADSGQIVQVLTNLTVNSRDAMSGVGSLAVETKNVRLEATVKKEIPDARAGDFVTIKVTDSGCGMAPEVLEHIFDPFFTTKAVGKGTGLGLAMVYGVVKQNGGFISVSSQEGQGTTFELFFPRTFSERKEQCLVNVNQDVLGGNETILLAEDEESVRTIATRLLQRLGYHVLQAESPVQALAMAEQYDGPIHLLLTDVIMPGGTGRDLALGLLKLRPKVKVVYMSGYTGDIIADRGVLRSEVVFLQKPFTRNELALVVRQALDSHAGSE